MCRAAVERGVSVVASAPSASLFSALEDPELYALFGEPAPGRGTASLHTRPVIDTVVELNRWTTWTIFDGLSASTVHAARTGQAIAAEVVTLMKDGNTFKEPIHRSASS